MTQSSFYSDTPNYATTYPTQNDPNTNPANGNSTAPSSFYPNGGVYEKLANSDTVLAQMAALEAQAAADAAAASSSASAASGSASSAATSATNAATSATNAAAAVQAAAGTATPNVDGTAAVGSSTKWAHEDHTHPTDATRAPLASPAFTGTPTAPTPPNADNSTKLATTAWVQTNAPGTPPATATPLMDGTAAVGVATKYAREDHVHPTDTTRAPLASPTFTGVPAAPTPTAGDNSTKIATTAFVTTALSPFRAALTADTTYYVRTDGSDSNNGLSNTPTGAFLTIAKALTVAGALDCQSYQLTISVQAGTFTVPVVLPRVLSAKRPILTGVGSTTIISCIAGQACITANGATPWQVNNMKLTGGDELLWVQNGSSVQFAGLEFAGTGTTYQILVGSGGQCVATGNYTVSGSAANHAAVTQGYIGLGQVTCTLVGTPNFSSAFVFAGSVGYLWAFSFAYSGSCTGPRYLANSNGVIFTSGGGATFFPGSVAGSTATGGQYI